MSRIGKKPVDVPASVQVELAGSTLRARGPKGTLSLDLEPRIEVERQGNRLWCKCRPTDRQDKAMHGLYRSLVRNMMVGVSEGFEKRLEIVGVGFNATRQGNDLALTVGFSNVVRLPIPEGLAVELPDATHIVVRGPDKQQVGQFAAVVRSVRKPEPYKGTGIRYAGEQVRRKAGKAFGSAGG